MGSVSATGGTSPYNISWPSDPNTLCAGTYTVTITDAAGCVTNVDITIAEPVSIPGCTDPAADNYDATANLDDGSCSYANCVSADTTESFESFGVSYTGDLNLWLQETSDDLNWTVLSGSTPSFNTGPDAAYDGTNYIYIETSSPAFVGQTPSIYTPCVDLSAWNNTS